MRTSSYGKTKNLKNKNPKELKKVSDMKWLRFIRKLKPYNIQKGLRYLKHYGPGIPDPSFGEDGAGGGSVRTVAGAVLRKRGGPGVSEKS